MIISKTKQKMVKLFGLRLAVLTIISRFIMRDNTEATTTRTITTVTSAEASTATSSNNTIDNQNKTNINVIMYPLEPFAYYTPLDTNIKGIIATLFLFSKNKCGEYKFTENYINLETRAQFIDTIHHAEEYPYGKGKLANITEQDEIFWLPYNFNVRNVKNQFWMDRKIEHVGLMRSKEMVIVLPRKLIHLPVKIIRGIKNSFVVILFGSLIGLFIGLLFWVVERPFNDQIDHPVTGAVTAIYWSFVTMTTVGYGDVTPTTLLGKMISVTWMMLGLVIASVVTATISQFVSGTEGLEISGQRVSVLENSYEHELVDIDYKGVAVTYDKYEEVIDAVGRGDVFAAALPYEVAAVMKDWIIDLPRENVLSIVYALPGRINFDVFVSNRFSKTELAKCMFTEIKMEDIRAFYEVNIKFETVYYDELEIEIKETIAFHVLYGMIGVAVFIGVILAYLFPKGKQKNKNNSVVEQYDSVEQKIDEKIGELSKLIDKLNHIKNNNSNNNNNNDNQKIADRGREFIY